MLYDELVMVTLDHARRLNRIEDKLNSQKDQIEKLEEEIKGLKKDVDES